MENHFRINTDYDPPDLTPLIDVIFILLVFFLLTSTMQEKIMEIDLPSSETANTNTADNIFIIEIDSNNIFYYERNKIDSNDIQRIIDKRVSADSTVSLTIRSDRETDFDSIIRILEAAEKGGIRGVNFTVTPE